MQFDSFIDQNDSGLSQPICTDSYTYTSSVRPFEIIISYMFQTNVTDNGWD